MPLFIIIIIATFAAILIYFAFFAKSEVPAEPEIIEEAPADSVIDATVIGKTIAEAGSRRNNFLTYVVTFECDDGEIREFNVNADIFGKLQDKERDTLVYNGRVFVGFGAHGAVGEAEDFSATDSGFTYDDYDESIDIEQVPDASEGLGLDGENRELYKQFIARKKLPTKVEEIEDETDSLKDYSALSLIKKTTLYPFLAMESDVRRMFARTYDEAMNDLLGFDGDSRRGRSADSVVVNKNEIRIAITLQEQPAPLRCKVHAEYGVNE